MERQIELGFYIKKESPYLSPMQVEDKDTEPYIRPVVDYSKTINPYLIPEHYPSAQPIDQIQRYGHFKILFELIMITNMIFIWSSRNLKIDCFREVL